MKLKWYTNKSKDYFINIKDIKTSTLETINPLFIKIYELSDHIEHIIKESIFTFLGRLDRLYLKDTIYTLVKETLINGVKANIKRSIFFYKGLDINNPEDYEKGVKTFKEEMLSQYDKFIARNKEENRYVMLRLAFDSNMLSIDIKNNSPLQEEEVKRINERIEKAKTFESMADIFTATLDNSEGAGLGIAMTVLLLKNEGFDVSNSFKIQSDGVSTVASFRLPMDIKKEQAGYKIATEMTEEIDKLPTFDENITKLQKLIREGKTSVNTISEIVRVDISLTTNILKLANSAAFATANRVENVTQAINLIGLRELNNMLYSIGTKRIMENRYEAFEEIWETSKECAFICSLLGKRKGFNKELSNNLSVAGLLHDIGRVIFLSLEEDTVRSVVKICGMRNEPPDLMLEEAVIGVSHTTIGAMIARKWNFPDSIEKAVEFHHNPYLVKSDIDKNVVYAVYLADRIIEFNQGSENFEKIYKKCLAHFNFDRTSFIKFAVDAKRSYIKYSYQKKL